MITTEARLGQSRYGTLRPEIHISDAPGRRGGDRERSESSREVLARLYECAARVVRALGDQPWAVQVDLQGETCGVVFLELLHGDPAEAREAMSLLESVVAAQRGA